VTKAARSAGDRAASAASRRERRAQVTDSDIVMAAAAAFLAVRPRSEAETRRRLRHLGYPAPLCDEVVDRLVRLGYLDDHAFAQAWVESRDRARPRGGAALRRELVLKGVAGEVIDDVLGQRSADAMGRAAENDADAAAARRLREKRAAGLRREQDPRGRRQKAYALLARHGFAPDVCAAVAASLDDVDAPGDGV